MTIASTHLESVRYTSQCKRPAGIRIGLRSDRGNASLSFHGGARHQGRVAAYRFRCPARLADGEKRYPGYGSGALGIQIPAPQIAARLPDMGYPYEVVGGDLSIATPLVVYCPFLLAYRARGAAGLANSRSDLVCRPC